MPGPQAAAIDVAVADNDNVTVVSCVHSGRDRYVLWTAADGVLVVDAAAVKPCDGFRVLLLDRMSDVKGPEGAVDVTHNAALLPAAHAQWGHSEEWGRWVLDGVSCSVDCW